MGFDPASGASGGGRDGRAGERADGVELDSGSGRGAEFHQAPIAGRVGVPVSGWSELARCGAQRAKAGADAGGLRGAAAMALGNCWLFCGVQGESQADWEGLLNDLYRRGLVGETLLLIVTDGCPGLAAAIPNGLPAGAASALLGAQDAEHSGEGAEARLRRGEGGAQAIYLADGRRRAEAAFRRFRSRWQSATTSMVRQLERDLPELLSFFGFPRHLWRKLRTTNVIERCFVEVRRRTRPMVCFVNVNSVDRIIYSIFQRFNLEWKNRTLRLFTQAA